jgi:hypothetical protein
MVGEVDFGSKIMGDVSDGDGAILNGAQRVLRDFLKSAAPIATNLNLLSSDFREWKLCLNVHYDVK